VVPATPPPTVIDATTVTVETPSVIQEADGTQHDSWHHLNARSSFDPDDVLSITISMRTHGALPVGIIGVVPCRKVPPDVVAKLDDREWLVARYFDEGSA